MFPATSIVFTCTECSVYTVFVIKLKLVPVPVIQVIPPSVEYSQVEPVSSPVTLILLSEVIKSSSLPVSLFKVKLTLSARLSVIIAAIFSTVVLPAASLVFTCTSSFE